MPENHGGVGRLTLFEADLSDAIAGAWSFIALLTEALSDAGDFWAEGVPETAASGTAGAAVEAVTAAKASAPPAPNRSSRPGVPRSRAVFVRIARRSFGFNAGLRSSISAATPLT